MISILLTAWKESATIGCGSCHNMIYSDEERREIHQRFKGNHPKVTKPKPKGLNTLKFIGLNRKVN